MMSVDVHIHVPSINDIQSHNDYFESIINLIPIDYYYGRERVQSIQQHGHGHGHGHSNSHCSNPSHRKASSTSKHIKQQYHQQHLDSHGHDHNNNTSGTSTVANAIMQRFDPDNTFHTVTSIQDEQYKMERKVNFATLPSNRKRGRDHDDDADDDEEDIDDDDNSEEDTDENNHIDAHSSSTSSVSMNGTNSTNAAESKPQHVTLDSLRARLHARIAELTPKRKISDTSNKGKELTGQQLKKLKKKQKLDESGRKQQNRPSKLQKSNHTTDTQTHANGNGSNTNSQHNNNNKHPSSSQHTNINNSSKTSSSSSNDTADFQFPKLNFGGADKVKTSHTLQGEMLRNDHYNKRANSDKAILQRINDFQANINELRAQGKHSEADALLKEHRMNSALTRATGVAVKDNKILLKKAIKQKSKKHEKSARQWKEREKEVKLKNRENQQKKQANIQKRIDSSKKGKTAKLRHQQSLSNTAGFTNGGKFIN